MKLETVVVEVPTFCQLPLLNDDGGLVSGAAFGLTKAARDSFFVTIDDWQVEVRKGEEIVVARGGCERSCEEAFSESLVHAQKGLDLMSVRGSNDLVIKEFDVDYIVWWPETEGLVIRICSIGSMEIDVPAAKLVVKDATGNVVPSPAGAPLLWHESYRYFRLSQTTDDLFDAYRNAYLALESVLSSIAPQTLNHAGRPAEREGQWFRRSLVEAGQLISLSSIVPPGTPDPVQYLFDELYVRMRSAMSHAKSGRPILLPRNESERQDVSNSLQRLVSLYLKLSEVHLGARRLGGGMFAAAFRKPYLKMLDDMIAVVSDDESPALKTDAKPNPGGGTVFELAACAAAQAPEPFTVTRLWSAMCSDLGHLAYVRRVVGLQKDTPLLAVVLGGRLDVGSSFRLELLLGLRGSNTRQSRTRYSF